MKSIIKFSTLVCTAVFALMFNVSAIYAQAPVLAVYADAQYKGNNQSFGLGSYDMNTLAQVGNDRISSIKVKPGYKVTVYEHANYGGASKVYLSHVPFTSDFNDIISSLKVEEHIVVTVFADASFQGASQSFKIGTYNMGDLTKVGNDRISAIKVAPGYRVRVYEHANYQGASKTYTSDQVFIADFNDVISSIKVMKIN